MRALNPRISFGEGALTEMIIDPPAKEKARLNPTFTKTEQSDRSALKII
jgi:hypothetical protein